MIHGYLYYVDNLEDITIIYIYIYIHIYIYIYSYIYIHIYIFIYIFIKMPKELTTTACFIQEESSGGKEYRKHVSCFYAQGGNVGVLSLK